MPWFIFAGYSHPYADKKKVLELSTDPNSPQEVQYIKQAFILLLVHKVMLVISHILKWCHFLYFHHSFFPQSQLTWPTMFSTVGLVDSKRGCADKTYPDTCQQAERISTSGGVCFCNAILCNSSGAFTISLFLPLLILPYILHKFL